jgi:hypothetical protein
MAREEKEELLRLVGNINQGTGGSRSWNIELSARIICCIVWNTRTLGI